MSLSSVSREQASSFPYDLPRSPDTSYLPSSPMPLLSEVPERLLTYVYSQSKISDVGSQSETSGPGNEVVSMLSALSVMRSSDFPWVAKKVRSYEMTPEAAYEELTRPWIKLNKEMLDQISHLSSILPHVSENPKDLLAHLHSKSKYSELKTAHLPMLFALSAMKSRGFVSRCVVEVFKGRETPERAYRELAHCNSIWVKPREKVIAQIGLLALGLSPAACDAYGDTVFHRAARWNEVQFMEAVLSHTKVSFHPPQCSVHMLITRKNETICAPLAIAAAAGCDAPLKRLLDVGCSEEDREEALSEAALKGHENTMSLLFNAGCSRLSKEKVLSKAAFEGQEGAVNLLLDAGYSRLSKAAFEGQNLLLGTSCRKTARGKALYSAALSGAEGVARALLRFGCSEEAREEALGTAACRNQSGIVSLLLAAGCSELAKGEALCLAAYGGFDDPLQLLLDAGCSKKDREEAVRLADVSLKWTSMELIASYGH